MFHVFPKTLSPPATCPLPTKFFHQLVTRTTCTAPRPSQRLLSPCPAQYLTSVISLTASRKPCTSPSVTNTLQLLLSSIYILLFLLLLIATKTNMKTQTHSLTTTPVGHKFAQFYENWVYQLEQFVKDLITLSNQSLSFSSEEEQRALVSKLTSHHKEYYTVKWASAHEDVLPFFSPVWLTKLETSFSWVTGWKPASMFRFLEFSSGGLRFLLTEEQGRKIEELRVRVKLEEEKVEREMERQQVAMADRKMVEMGRRARSGEEGMAEVAVKSIVGGLERVMKAADCVRLKTLKGILDILSPRQSVEFLAATGLLQVQLRQWGKRMEFNRNNNNLMHVEQNVIKEYCM